MNCFPDDGTTQKCDLPGTPNRDLLRVLGDNRRTLLVLDSGAGGAFAASTFARATSTRSLKRKRELLGGRRRTGDRHRRAAMGGSVGFGRRFGRRFGRARVWVRRRRLCRLGHSSHSSHGNSLYPEFRKST